MNGIKSCASLQFNQNTPFNNYIGTIISDNEVFVLNLEGNFMLTL